MVSIAYLCRGSFLTPTVFGIFLGYDLQFWRNRKMKIKRNAAFKLFAYGKNKDKYQIRLRVTFNSQRIDLGTGCQIALIDAWDEGEELVRPGYKGPKGETATTINDELRKCKDTIDMVFQYYEVNDKIPTPSEVQASFKERIAGILPKRPEPEPKKTVIKPKEPDFFSVFDEFTKKCGEKNAWTEATFDKMAAIRADLMSFCPKVKLSKLDENMLTGFVGYLRDEKVIYPARNKKDKEEDEKEKKPVRIGLNNTTIRKKLEYLTWFLRWARDSGFAVNPAFKTFKPTLKQTQNKVIYLTKDELARIRDLDLSGTPRLEPVRDIFLFCCLTSLRHSDADNLRRTDVKGEHIEVTTIKTGDSVSIKLNKNALAILEKYKDVPFPGNRALPSYTNQAMNRSLKELCQLAGIDDPIRITTYKGNTRKDEVHPKWELVGTHTGRRTFIVHALSMGISPSVVMKWTGHSDYKAMKPYIDIVDSAKDEAMAKFDNLL